MRTLRTTGLLATIAGITGIMGIVGISLLTGCVSVGYGPDGDRGHFYPSGPSGPSADDAREVEGTVERVDAADRRIVISEAADDAEAAESTEKEPGGREIALYYGDDTVVEYGGQSYRPENLEPGDRIHAETEVTKEGLAAQKIEVLSDVNAGEDGVSPEPSPDDPRHAPPLSGTVRFVDTRAHTLEIEVPGEAGRPDLVQVLYDGETILEYQGERYSPENLERGDRVEIEARPHGGRLLAEHILVEEEGQDQ